MKKISLFSFLAAALLCVGQNAIAAAITIFDASDAGWTATGVNLTTGATSVGDVTWNGRGSAEIKSNNLTFSDNVQWTAYLKFGGSSTFQSSKTLAGVLTYTPTAAGTLKVYTKGGGDSARKLYVSQSISNTNRDPQTVIATADGANKAASIAVASVKADEIVYIWGDNNMYVYGITFEATAVAKDDATLKAIKIGDAELKGFDAATTEYNVELPYGTTTAPEVSATATSDKANVAITPATSATGTATIVVTAEDGTTTKTYTIHFTVSTSVSTDATLKSLSIDGNAVAGFRADSLDYTYEIAYTAALPVISAEVNDIAATMEITQVTETPGTATVVVTAQDGTTKITYSIEITRHAAIKHLTVVPFSNGAKGAIDESAQTVTVPYLAGTDEPTVDVAGITTSGDGASAALSEDGKTITLTGADGVSTEYTIVLQPLAANSELGTDLIIFDGTETYIFGVYGFEAEGTDSKGNPTYKGWKFAKNQDDEGNMRNASGKTRIYMALPPAKSVALTSGTGGARDVKIFVNGVQSSVTATEAKDKAITLTLNESQDNFIAIESNQTKGDGGFTAMLLTKTPEGPETSFEQAEVSVKAVKVVRNGQLFILRDGKTYNAQGIVVE